MSPARRMLLLVTLLALCAAAVVWDRLRARPEVGVSAAVERPRPAAAPAREVARTPAPAAAGTVASLRSREGWGAAGADAFQPATPPAPKAVPVQPSIQPAAPSEPARPTAPALPFTVLGKKFDRGTWEVYLGSGEQVYVAKVGMLLTEKYRVEAIAPSEIRLTYLPLNERQILQTGASFND